jgi:CarD family transcriptional regulator
MFEVGEMVVYGSTGVCDIIDIIDLEISKGKTAKYYKLVPVEKKNSSILTPVENPKVVMRKMMSKAEAEKLVDSLPELEPVDIPNDKKREEIYRNTVNSCDPKMWFSFIKTLYTRKKTRLEQGRKTTSMDDRYYRVVENGLFGELALVLGKEKNEIACYVKSTLDNADE